MRFHEKGGNEHEAPCHHKLEVYMDEDEYVEAARIAGDPDGPLWRTTGRKTRTGSGPELKSFYVSILNAMSTLR
jgi:hypothetical protein